MNIKTKLGAKLEIIQKELKELINNTDFDWSKVLAENGDVSYKGVLNNLLIEVKPTEVTFMITRADDPEGKMTEKRTIAAPDGKIKSAMFLELEHRFGAHNDYSFFNEAKSIIEEANLVLQQELEQKNDKNNNKKPDEPKSQTL